jgi:hypothetical protein
MLEALSTPQNQRRTYLLLLLSVVFVVAAGAIGINDNPPGLLCALLSAMALLLALAHPWRTSRAFFRLLYWSALSFVVFAVLHNAFEALSARPGLPSLVQSAFGAAGIAFFFLALFLSPAGLLIGGIGAAVMSWRSRHPHSHAAPV